jgi:sulfonate transport system substrate-binding protein
MVVFASLWRLLSTLALLIGVLASAACGGETATTSAASTTSTSPSAMAASDESLRVGYQKYSWETVLQARGTRNLEVSWSEFPSGPAITEALNAGSIDVGELGEAPPVFGQAAGVPFTTVAAAGAAPMSEAVLVARDSPIHRVEDLRGRTVALNRGSNVQYLLVKLLGAHGLTLDDVEVRYLAPADARPAFESGAVDAWVIWDPFLSIAQATDGARRLADGTGLVANHIYFVASTSAVRRKAAALRTFLAQLGKAVRWAVAHPDERAALIGGLLGIPVAALVDAARRSGPGLVPIDDGLIAGQQEVADTFARLGLIPNPIKVAADFDTAFNGAIR